MICIYRNTSDFVVTIVLGPHLSMLGLYYWLCAQGSTDPYSFVGGNRGWEEGTLSIWERRCTVEFCARKTIINKSISDRMFNN